MPQPYDLITMGRIGVDIYPLRTGVSLAQVDTFRKFLGGSPSNVAVAGARLGLRTAVVTRTGQDPFGGYLRRQLREFGVDDRWVGEVAAYPTPVTFCELFPPDDFPLYFYRLPKAPDLEIHADELDLDAVRAARIFWVTGTGLSAEPSRTATLAALNARTGGPRTPTGPGTPTGGPGAAPVPGAPERRPVTVFDLDWRPMFWPGGDTDPEAPLRYREALAYATVAVGNLEECAVATGEREPYAAARALLDAGVELAVVKQGPKGVLAVHRNGTVAEVPPLPVRVVNGLGAGDAFGGALCHGLLAGWETERVMRYANAAGAIVASRLACSSAMPFPAEVEEALALGEIPDRPEPGLADGPEPGSVKQTAQTAQTAPAAPTGADA
ncbi:5-dehydro-2-deoxygluconokinase [Streptomyces sp. NBC_00102]|uniref:5-dehydro-2-deoxygluconokinase n=1 Tax=Streptomyces sp. NBC_00102 TaxID=2975652 RepID=UPI002257051E|nr:5-dehydro-2-deoxygluconokinase [Streptomyces sp. NBC_00102]MCX5397108.1 5-dehydro-2-deoxygluconokinase [Streptomyces sp. NBC_00102]